MKLRKRFLVTLYSCVFLFGFTKLNAQQQLRPLIQQQFDQLLKTNKYLTSDITEWKITDQYQDPSDGLTHVYVQQQQSNLKVFNAISVFAFKGNDVVYFKPGLIDHLQSKINGINPSIDALNAILSAFGHLNITLNEQPKFISNHHVDNLFEFELTELCSSPITVQLLYKQTSDQDVRLAWNVSFEMRHEPHWWNIRIDAATGIFLDQNDYTLQCGSSSDANDQASLSEFQSPNTSSPSGAIPSYRVFPYPIEAPSFGSRALLIDPSNPNASPFAWHDTNGLPGEEYTITRGNNVYAYEDANNDNIPGYSPDGGAGLTFDYPFINGASVNSNLDASLTNLFYLNNTIHDYLYALGFTEVAGNFQSNNYGNGGLANDPVKAEGIDGGGTNNANFSTPPDGSSGRMQMYLWTGDQTPCTTLNISSSSFTGSMVAGGALFSPITSVTANVILANDGVNPSTDACSALVNNVSGKIVLIDRGTCTYLAKAQAAQTAGAVGVIIANTSNGPIATMSGTPVLNIPVVSISLSDGNTLKAALLSGTVNASISTCTVNPIDGSFDNGVVAHEYGHGVSNRLTGGPSQANCLSNAEQGGEGWSDWLALMMTIEPGDHGYDSRGIGTYALAQAPGSAGIRRFPYSTNMSINGQTYADLATSSTVHQRGEIWCSVLWDMSWKLIDAYGFSTNPYNTNAGNNIAIKLVLEGMKLQPCSPGYLDARDAILNADALLYNNAHRCLIWQAFAGRGMGYNAVQGSSNVVGDEVASFTMPPFCLPPTQIPVAAFTSDSTSIGCGKAIHFTDQSVQAFNWLWSFGDGTISILQNPSHTYSSPGSYTVKLKVGNPLGNDSVTHTILVTATFTANVSATPGIICGGTPVNLNAIASGSTNKSYSISAIPYAPLSGTGTVVALGDDQMSSAKPIGFTFNFYGTNYTSFYICSNGFITFSSGMPSTVVYGEPLPNFGPPSNLIALAWNDLNPSVAPSSISYFTTGTSPNRKLVISYSTAHYLSPTNLPFIVQAILYEGSNVIEIHTNTISDASSYDPDATTTQGVENIGGLSGVAVPGRNGTTFSASHDAYRFTPYVPYSYNWLPGNLSGASQVVTPMSSGSYTVQVNDGTACTTSFISPSIMLNPCPVTLNLSALIQGYYLGGGLMRPVLFNSGLSTNTSLCDSLQIELHAGTAPYGLVSTAIGILNTNGTLTCSFTILPGSYYIVLKHRNGLQTWSANPIVFNGSPVSYSFTDASSKAFGGNLYQVDATRWAIYSGDINHDLNMDLLDLGLLELDVVNFMYGYNASDINGDGNSDLLDTPILEDNINNFIFAVYP